MISTTTIAATPRPRTTLLAACLALTALAGGCQTTGPRSDAQVAADAPAADTNAAQSLTERDPRDVPVLSGDTGERLSWDELVDRAASADAVLIGEQHGHRLGLAAAAALFEDVIAQRAAVVGPVGPRRGSLALEFWERDEQVHLDDAATGVRTLDEAAEAAGKTGSGFPPGHRAMVETAIERRLPLVAANAPRRYVRLARTDGFARLEGLTPEQRQLFVVPAALSEGEYRRRFFDIMGAMRGQSGSGKAAAEDDANAGAEANPDLNDPMILSFFRAQNVWDATMARSVADLIGRNETPAFLVVGQFHTDFAGGTLDRLRELRPDADILTVSLQSVDAEALRDEDADRADVILYVGPRQD